MAAQSRALLNQIINDAEDGLSLRNDGFIYRVSKNRNDA